VRFYDPPAGIASGPTGAHFALDAAEKKEEDVCVPIAAKSTVRFVEGPSEACKTMEDSSSEETEPPAAFRSETFALFGKRKNPTAAATPAAVAPAERFGEGFGEGELAGIKTMIHKLSTNQITPSKATYSNATKDLAQPRAKPSNAARAEEKASLRTEAAALAKVNADFARAKGVAAAEAKCGGTKAVEPAMPETSSEASAKETPVHKIAGNK
jgi:hypothetical protein